MRTRNVNLLLAVVAVCASTVVPAAAAGTKTTTVDVKAVEFSFTLSTKKLAKPGTVAFVVKNAGHLSHDFKIDGKKTALIQPGKSAKLTVDFKKQGSYPYLCTVPGHAAAGMKGVFTVH